MIGLGLKNIAIRNIKGVDWIILNEMIKVHFKLLILGQIKHQLKLSSRVYLVENILEMSYFVLVVNGIEIPVLNIKN